MFFSLESKWVLKELNYLLTINRLFRPNVPFLRLFKALGLSFLPNFPGPTFISCPTSIPESRLGLGQNLPFLARALHPQCINQTVRLQLLLSFGKFFTYVTKTRANSTTYSRKLENYNGTIIFEIDIMKNSSPINLNLCQT